MIDKRSEYDDPTNLRGDAIVSEFRLVGLRFHGRAWLLSDRNLA